MPEPAIDTPAKRTADYSRLTQAEESLCLHLANDGLTQTAIAQRLGCHPSSVSRTLAAFTDTRELAKRRLQGSADRLVRRVISKATVEESLEVLDRIDVAPKRQSGAGSSVNILIGMPGQAIGPDVIVVPTAQIAGNDNAHYETQTQGEGQ